MFKTLQAPMRYLAPTDTQGGQAFLGVASDHLVDEADQYTTARCTYWVTESDSAAIDIDLVDIPIQLLAD